MLDEESLQKVNIMKSAIIELIKPNVKLLKLCLRDDIIAICYFLQ